MVEIEVSLVKAFNWSLKDIDETDIESLIPFVFHFSGAKTGTGAGARRMYCDDADWL